MAFQNFGLLGSTMGGLTRRLSARTPTTSRLTPFKPVSSHDDEEDDPYQIVRFKPVASHTQEPPEEEDRFQITNFTPLGQMTPAPSHRVDPLALLKIEPNVAATKQTDQDDTGDLGAAWKRFQTKFPSAAQAIGYVRFGDPALMDKKKVDGWVNSERGIEINPSRLSRDSDLESLIAHEVTHLLRDDGDAEGRANAIEKAYKVSMLPTMRPVSSHGASTKPSTTRTPISNKDDPLRVVNFVPFERNPIAIGPAQPRPMSMSDLMRAEMNKAPLQAGAIVDLTVPDRDPHFDVSGSLPIKTPQRLYMTPGAKPGDDPTFSPEMPKPDAPFTPKGAKVPEMLSRGVVSGVSSLAAGAGGMLQAVAAEGSAAERHGQALVELDKKIQKLARPAERYLVDVFENPELAKDPEWWAYTAGTTLGSMVGFMVPAQAGAMIGGRLAVGAAALLSRTAQARELFMGTGFVLGGGVVEGLIEGGSAFNDAIAAGKSKKEAGEIAASVAALNVPLIAGTAGLGYLPQLFNAGGAKSAAKRTIQWFSGGMMESGQEVGQQGISNRAAGRPITEGMGTAAVGGFIGGGVAGPTIGAMNTEDSKASARGTQDPGQTRFYENMTANLMTPPRPPSGPTSPGPVAPSVAPTPAAPEIVTFTPADKVKEPAVSPDVSRGTSPDPAVLQQQAERFSDLRALEAQLKDTNSPKRRQEIEFELTGIRRHYEDTYQAIEQAGVDPVQVRHTVEQGQPEAPSEPYSYSTTQFNLPEPVAERVLDLGRKIPDVDLAEDGRETEPHLTVKYGLHTEDVEEVRAALADMKPFKVKLGATSFFPNGESDSGDVLKVDVSSAYLSLLNKRLAKALDHSDTKAYSPHVTIAYLKAGRGEAYTNDDALKGTEILVDRITFGGKNGQRVEIPLGTQAQPVPPQEFQTGQQAAKEEIALSDQQWKAATDRWVAARRDLESGAISPAQFEAEQARFLALTDDLSRANEAPLGAPALATPFAQMSREEQNVAVSPLVPDAASVEPSTTQPEWPVVELPRTDKAQSAPQAKPGRFLVDAKAGTMATAPKGARPGIGQVLVRYSDTGKQTVLQVGKKVAPRDLRKLKALERPVPPVVAPTVPASQREHFDQLLKDARQNGYEGDDKTLEQLYLQKLDEARLANDGATLASEDADSSRELLVAISKMGGIGLEAEGEAGMRGELETMLEGLNRHAGIIRRGARAGQRLPASFRRAGGLPGAPNIITRSGGRPLDTVLESIHEDPRWEHRFESLSDFTQAIDDAIRIETGTTAAPAAAYGPRLDATLEMLGVAPGTDWWEPGRIIVTPHRQGAADEANERAAIRGLNARRDTLQQDYEAQFGRVVNDDNMRELLGAHSPDRRWGNLNAVRSSSGAAVRQVFRQILDEPMDPTRDAVLLTAGGPGSGKSTSAGEDPSFFAVFDSTLHNYEQAKALIEQVKASGRVAVVRYVRRNPVEAFMDGVLTRALDPSNGRPVSIKSHAEKHVEGRETIARLIGEYADDLQVPIVLAESTPSGLKPIDDLESAVEEARVYNDVDALRADIETALRREIASGRQGLTPELAARLGLRPEDRPAVAGDGQPEARRGDQERPAEGLQPAPLAADPTPVSAAPPVRSKAVSPARTEDILATGEIQPRLPGDVGAVRDQEVADAKLELKRADPDDFSLSAQAVDAGQPRLSEPDDSDSSPAYKAAYAAYETAHDRFQPFKQDYENRTISPDVYLREAKAFDAAKDALDAAERAERAARRAARKPAEAPRQSFSAKSLQSVFGITATEAEAAVAIAEAMDLDTDKILLTAGGVPGKGALEQPGQQGTKAFKKWFGRSVVVDTEGPRRVYHGTSGPKPISAFKESVSGLFGRGSYFTESAEDADNYAGNKLVKLKDGSVRTSGRSAIVPVYLQIEHPFEMDGRDTWQDLFEVVMGRRPKNDDAEMPSPAQARALQAAMVAQGHDGIVIKNFEANLTEDFTTHYVVFSPEQVKSATGNQGTFDPKNPNILYQEAPVNAPKLSKWYYSNISKALATWQPKGTAAQLLAHLQKFKGANEEAETIGFGAWLKSQEKVTRAEAQAWLGEHQIHVQDVVRRSRGTDDQQEARSERYMQALQVLERHNLDVASEEANDPPIALIHREERDDRGELKALIAEDIKALPQEAQDAWDVVEEQERLAASKDLKYAAYQTPGGTGYREVLLTLPASATRTVWRVIDRNNNHIIAKFDNYEEAAKLADEKDLAVSEKQDVPAKDTYQSSHWDEPNVLAHVRMNDREVDGQRVLFVEEIQSDWHPALRKHLAAKAAGQLTTKVPDAPFKGAGWKKLALKRALAMAAEGGYDGLAWTTGSMQQDRYDLSKQAHEISAFNRGDGTFDFMVRAKDTNRTHDISKVARDQVSEHIGKDLAERVLKQPAGEWQGYTGLDLKVGGQWAENLYDRELPNLANDIVRKYGVKAGTIELPNTNKVMAYSGPSNVTGDDLDKLIKVSRGLGNSTISPITGREAGHPVERASVTKQAQDIRAYMQAGHSFVEAMNTHGSPMMAGMVGGKMVDEDRGVSVHHLPLTQQMREDVRDNGLPLFQGAKAAVEFAEGGKAIIRALERPDVSSPAHELAHVARRFLLDRNVATEDRLGISDEDIATAETWAGAANGVWGREAEEKFARGFERYLQIGKAPTTKLQALFDKFATWLTDIYRDLKGSDIDVEISAPMQAVFDKLVTRRTAREQRDAAPERQSKPAPTKARASTPTPVSAEPVTGTGDAGAELTFNKRNRRRGGLTWEDVVGQNQTLRVSQTTKANVYPQPEYAALIDGGMEPVVAHIVKQVYDAIAVKPQTTAPTDADLQAYIAGVNRVMDGTLAWANNKDAIRKWANAQVRTARAMQGTPTSLSDLVDVPTLSLSVYPESKQGLSDALRNEARLIGGRRVLGALHAGYSETARATKAVAGGWPAKQEAWQRQGYKVVSSAEAVQVKTGERYVSGGKETVHYLEINRRGFHDVASAEAAEARKAAFKPWLLLKKSGRIEGEFDTKADAEDAARAAVKRESKAIDVRGTAVTEAERTGPPRREPGQNISSDVLLETFEFKGINFGNWLKGKGGNEAERQLHLNHAYDAFADMADILGIPPKAISLNGLLGVAFGAQGSGKNAAHFVPGVNEINLTRTQGAGTVAHEYGHALDHYFATQAGLAGYPEPFLTEHVSHPGTTGYNRAGGKRTAPDTLRPEIAEAFRVIVSSMNRVLESGAQAETRLLMAGTQALKSVNGWLGQIKRDFTSAGVAESAFDALAERIRTLDLGDGKVAVGNAQLSPAVAALRDLYKSAGGSRAYSLDSIKSLQSNVDYLAYLKSDAIAGRAHTPQTVSTDYSRQASALDQEKGGKAYWSTNLEKFARAFDAFVRDRLAARATRNTYLSRDGQPATWEPQGAERIAINEAFDTLIGEFQVTPDTNVLYQEAPPTASELEQIRARRAALVSELGATLRGRAGMGIDFDALELVVDIIKSYLDEGIVRFKDAALAFRRDYPMGADLDDYFESAWQEATGETHLVADALASPETETDIAVAPETALATKASELSKTRRTKQDVIDDLSDALKDLRQTIRSGGVQMREARVPYALIAATAKEQVAAAIVRDLRPAEALATVRPLVTKATEAAARGEFDKAGDLEHEALSALALYREQQRVVKDIDARVRRARLLGTKSAQQRLGLAGQEMYRAPVNAILDGYSFERFGRKALDKRASLLEFIEKATEENMPVDIPAAVREGANRVPYQELTVGEFVEVTDTLDHLLHLSGLKNRLLKSTSTRTFNEQMDDLAASIAAHSRGARRTALEPHLASNQIGRGMAGFAAWQRKLGSLIREMDGGKDGGPMWEAVMRPINASADDETVRQEAAAVAFADTNKTFTTDDKVDLSKPMEIPEIGDSLTRAARIIVALNWGNPGNQQRLMSGFDWSESQVQAILDTLTEKDWTFVKAVWAHINSYKAEIVAKQERVFGVAPEMIEGVPFQTKFGEVPGGYFPIKYDPEADPKAYAHNVKELAEQMMRGQTTSSTTRRGFTQARQEVVKNRRMRLDFSTIWQHTADVIHDLTHHEMLIDVNRILRHPKVATAIRQHYGMPVYRELQASLQDIAAGDVPVQHQGERALEWLRQGTSIARMGWNLMTSAVQPLGLTVSVVRIGPKWVARGVARWLGDAARMENTVSQIHKQSAFMRLRHKTLEREIREIQSRIQPRGAWALSALGRSVAGGAGARAGHEIASKYAAVEDSYFWFISRAQMVADIPTWLGGYEKARAQGNDEKRSVALADQAVIDSQGSGHIKDMAHSQRGTPSLKLFTQFMGYFSVVYNQGSEAIGRTRLRNPASIGRLAVDLLMLYTVPMVLEEALRAAISGGDDDDDDLLVKFARSQAAYFLNTVVFARELGGAVEGYRYSGPAGGGVFDEAARLITQIGQGKVDDPLVKSLNNTAGIVFHYPATQVERLVRVALALKDGTATPSMLFRATAGNASERPDLSAAARTVRSGEQQQSKRAQEAVAASVEAFFQLPPARQTQDEIIQRTRALAKALYADPDVRDDKFSDLLTNHRVGVARGQKDQVLNAVLTAGSNAQKLAVLAAASEKMSPDDFRAWVKKTRPLQVVSSTVLDQAMAAVNARAR
ncbi:MAG: 2'-5' RNA ligase family protein [Acidobacteria bacterium]|nr:2'-5' RNA ligase family protein [Acidobacteriota bacterium]